MINAKIMEIFHEQSITIFKSLCHFSVLFLLYDKIKSSNSLGEEEREREMMNYFLNEIYSLRRVQTNHFHDFRFLLSHCLVCIHI
jgi:hypothetical protein